MKLHSALQVLGSHEHKFTYLGHYLDAQTYTVQSIGMCYSHFDNGVIHYWGYFHFT